MSQAVRIATVTLNPAIDQTVSIPNFQAGQVNRVQHSRSDPGGKGVNVASFLSDYGFPVSVTGFLGRENTALFEQLFAAKDIDDRFVRIAGSTRTGIKIVDDANQTTTDINFPGQAPTPADVDALFQAVEDLTAGCEWFVLSGSIPVGLSAGVYRELIELIKAQGRAVAPDTSGEGLQRAVPAAPTLMKPNIEELRELSGEPLPNEEAAVEAAQGLLAQGVA